MSSRVGYPGTRGQSGGVRSSSGNSSSSSSKMSREGSKEIPLDPMKASEPKPTKLDPTLLSSAISSGMPTFLLTKGVPIIDRRNKRFVSARALARVQRKKVPPQCLDYPPDRPLCLRGHTPSMVGPSGAREEPKKSVRGPRGAIDVPTGAFAKSGVLGGLSVSPWVVQEEAERARRAESHTAAISKDPVVFRRKREEGGLLDYAEETHAMKRFLDKIHPLKDESCPPKSGFSYRKVCHASFVDENFSQSWTAEAFPVSGEQPQEQRSPSNQEAEAGGATIEFFLPATDHLVHPLGGLSFFPRQVRPMWSRQGLRTRQGSSSFSSPVLRPFTSSHDHLGRPMSCGVLSRSTSGLKPQQFDTTQRRSEYTCALVTKRQARLAREAREKLAAKVEAERSKNAAEGREGIDKFEGSLKEVLAQKWKYL